MNVEMRDIDSIRPYDRNPRQNDMAVASVAKSIDEFGFRQPIVVDENGIIIVGHTRWKAAKFLKMTEVPVHVAVGMTPDQARAYRIADNKTAELASWDDGVLANEILALSETDIDMTDFGFDEKEIAQILNCVATPSESEWANSIGNLSNGEPTIRSRTFTLSAEQEETVKSALNKAVAAGPFADNENTNQHGNALARICEDYLGR